MARKLRLEYPGALYHIINRGNYRSWIFRSEGAKKAFEATLFETCERAGWILHAYVLMGNHFHLALETPEGNLVDGMRWLQSVFAMRFNRFRKEHGVLFQGRYKSIIIENGHYLSWLCHYIHLNPVRARICSFEGLRDYRWGSYWYLYMPKIRPGFIQLECCLEGAGDLKDTKIGRKKYEQYLEWIGEDESTRKAMQFDRMSKGWVMGTKSFKKDLIKEEKTMVAILEMGDSDAKETREIAWELSVQSCLSVLGVKEDAIAVSRKTADWKVAVAGYMKRNRFCRNGWLVKRLHMGSESTVSHYVSRMILNQRPEAKRLYEKILSRIMH